MEINDTTNSKVLLVTGAAGFIGSTFVRVACEENYRVVILDALTYAGHMANLKGLVDERNCIFIKGDIADRQLTDQILEKHKVSSVVHFAAESHVDNSISGPLAFMNTNILGTFHLLEGARKYFENLKTIGSSLANSFRFLHVSTDEVFGALGETGQFSEETAYAPNSPYSASKAASDHLVRAWYHTYKLPTVTTNCSNNYGPRQFPEKLIPRMITAALSENKLPVYGAGKNIRDWIHVEDHSRGVLLALEKGKLGESYCFGGNSERTNIEVVESICRILDRKKPRAHGKSYSELIHFVEDRKGHDFRYAIDDQKAQNELGFKRKYQNFESGLLETINWYFENSEWLKSIQERNK